MRLYREALERLIRREPRSPALEAAARAGKGYAINPTTVAMEAGKSRNPLYSTHKAILAEIEIAGQPIGLKRRRAPRLESAKGKLSAMRDEIRILKEEKAKLATQNLGLLLRLREADQNTENLERTNARLVGQIAQERGLASLQK
jgi:hypothetical protein